MILGIDEVGRGPWAGPVAVGAVVLGDVKIEGLTDSKKLSKRRRKQLDVQIREQAAGYGLGWAAVGEIDTLGLSKALALATRRAVEQVRVPYHEIIIDGTVNFLQNTAKGSYVTTLKKADLLIPAVSAASIIAKVARDAYMAAQDDVYQGYNFSAHAGYGTAAHQAALRNFGVTPLHRLSFTPIAAHAANRQTQTTGDDTMHKTTTRQIGNAGEAAAARYLMTAGHTVVAQNWRTRWCEIDIVSRRGDTVYFSEVKYRSSDRQGGGLAAISSQKRKQMKFAAELFAGQYQLADYNLRLCVIDVTGQPPVVSEYLELG